MELGREATRRSRRPPRRRGGFTFLELILVLAVLGIIFSLGAVKLTSALPKYSLRTAAREVGTKIEEVRMVAISGGSWTGIRYHLDPDRSGYELLPPAPLDFPDEPIEERTPLARREFPDVHPGVRIASVEMRGTGEVRESGVVDVYFSPTGTVGSHIVRLVHAEGRTYTLSFNALTGTVDFHEKEVVGFGDFEG